MFSWSENPALAQLVTNAADHAVHELSGGHFQLRKSSDAMLQFSEAMLAVFGLFQLFFWLRSRIDVPSLWQNIQPTPSPLLSKGLVQLDESQALFELCKGASFAKLSDIAESRAVTVHQLRAWLSAWAQHVEFLQLLAVRLHPLPAQGVEAVSSRLVLDSPKAEPKRNELVPDSSKVEPKRAPRTHYRQPRPARSLSRQSFAGTPARAQRNGD
jgi:hypothetical protein